MSARVASLKCFSVVGKFLCPKREQEHLEECLIGFGAAQALGGIPGIPFVGGPTANSRFQYLKYV
jgi:hypothetical protein